MISLLLMAVCSKGQTPVVAKTLTTIIYAAEKYESSKQKLLALMDSSSCSLISMNETKTDNGNQKIVIEFAASDNAFKIIDKRLLEFGYTSYKNLISYDVTESLDTAALTRDISFLKQQQSKNALQLAMLKPESKEYAGLWEKQSEIETKIWEKEKALNSATRNLLATNKIHITLAE